MYFSSVHPKCFFIQNNDLLFNICDVFLHQLWNIDFNCAAVGWKSSHGGRTWLLCFIYPNEKLLVNKGRILLDLVWHTSQTIFTLQVLPCNIECCCLGLGNGSSHKASEKNAGHFLSPWPEFTFKSYVKGGWGSSFTYMLFRLLLLYFILCLHFSEAWKLSVLSVELHDVIQNLLYWAMKVIQVWNEMRMNKWRQVYIAGWTILLKQI